MHYKSISCSYYDILEATATRKIYSKIQYFTELKELITVNALIKTFVTENREEFMLLCSGEKIRLDRVVSVNDHLAPTYSGFEDFTCDC